MVRNGGTFRAANYACNMLNYFNLGASKLVHGMSALTRGKLQRVRIFDYYTNIPRLGAVASIHPSFLYLSIFITTHYERSSFNFKYIYTDFN